MIQNNASWKKRVRNVLNGKWKGLCEKPSTLRFALSGCPGTTEL